MRRLVDVLLSSATLLIALPIFIVVALVVWRDTGNPIFTQKRLGKHCTPFSLYKFRTMPVGTQSVATHLLETDQITRSGNWLRASKLDELPQLLNVIKGDMSLVGPRPCLPNQKYLIFERKKRGVFETKPGLTGLAQIMGVDMSTPKLLAQIDSEMVSDMSLMSYFNCLFRTLRMILRKS